MRMTGKAMIKLKIGKVYSIAMTDGDSFTGEYIRFERGFGVFLSDGKEVPMRWQFLKSATEVCGCCCCTPCDCHL